MAQCRSNKKNQILKYILNKETPEEAFEPDTEEEALLELIARKVKSGYYGANVSDALIEQVITEYLTEHPIEAVEIANNLTTATTGKALDAAQGRALKELLDALSERIDNLPTGGGTGGGSAIEYMYYGYIPYVENNPLQYTRLYEDIAVPHIDHALLKGYLKKATPAVTDKTSLGFGSEIPEGANCLVLIPESANLKATKDNGIGGKVAYAEDTNGANGTKVVLNGVSYEAYGEILLASAELFMYVDNK